MADIGCFDCHNDMGNPHGCAVHVRSMPRLDGRWIVVEPIGGNLLEQTIGNPVSRLYYNASTMISSSVRRATEGPFNMILEARI